MHTMAGQRKKTMLIFALMLVLVFLVSGQEDRINFDVTGSLDWRSGELRVEAGFDLVRAGLKLPSGRFMGEEILREASPRLIRPALLSVRVDSGSTIGDLLDRGELSLEELDTLSLGAEKIPPSLSADLVRMKSRYTLFTGKIGGILSRHRRAVEPEPLLVPVQTADYTGIIIIADEELPVHGRNTATLAEPCLFPKIWETDMKLILERNMAEPGKSMVRYAARDSIFRATPSGLEGELAALLGPNPLRILARAVFGTHPTDPVIDRDDARKILSTENNRSLLREGRVVLVLNAGTLLKPAP